MSYSIWFTLLYGGFMSLLGGLYGYVMLFLLFHGNPLAMPFGSFIRISCWEIQLFCGKKTMNIHSKLRTK